MFNMDISNCDAVRSPQRILSLYFTSILQLMSSQRPDWGVFILKYDFERGANIQSHPEHLELSVYSWDLRMRNELNFYFRKENLTIIITITVANQKETFQPNFPVCSLLCSSNWSNLQRSWTEKLSGVKKVVRSTNTQWWLTAGFAISAQGWEVGG